MGSWMNLITGRSFWKCGPFVVPFRPADSFLLHKLTGGKTDLRPDPKNCDRWMPADYLRPSGMRQDTPLLDIDADAVRLVERWIREGALDN